MADSTFIKNLNNGTLTIQDGTGSPIDVIVPFDNGDFSISGLSQKLNEVVAYESRGTLNTVRHTSRTYPTFSFTTQMAKFTSATDTSVSDAILQNGAFASAVSTLSANADVYTLFLTFDVEGTDFGDSGDHQLTLDDCHCTIDFSEGDPNSFSISGTVYGTIGGDLAVAGS